MSSWSAIFLLVCLVAMTTAWHGHHRQAGNRHRGRQQAPSSHNHPGHRFFHAAIRGGNHRHSNHHQQHDNNNNNERRHPWDEVAEDLDWFPSDLHNPFLSSFFSMGAPEEEEHKPWWQGPNICEKKTENVENATSANHDSDILVHYTSTSQQCDVSESAYKCRLIEENVEGRREVTIVYECCHGYRRDEGEFGCPKRMELKPLMATAQDLRLTEFLQAVKMLELTEELDTGNFTIFAPVNGAFGLESDLVTVDGKRITPGTTKVLQDAPAAFEVSEPGLERTIETLQSAILGHVTMGALRSSSLNDEQVLETGHKEGSTIRINYFSRPAKLMTANCIPVASRDNLATNGVIHTVEKALKPVTETLLDLVATRPDLTLLKTVLAAADYVPKLEEDGKLTLLAPTNGAFQKMSRRLRERLLSGDKKCIQSVLMYHMLPNVICSAAFQKHSRTLNILGKYVRVARTDDEKLFVDDAQVVSKDIMARNGVMHIVDKVMVPEEALGFLDVLERKGLTELINLIELAGLIPTLEEAKNVTFLAPTNEAIEKLSVGLKSKLISNTDLLKQVLTYHVSPSQVDTQHFHNNRLIPSLEGRQVRLNRFTINPFYSGTRTAQCAPIAGQPIKTCNGNLNLISQVMIPPVGNVIDVLATDKRFSTLIGYLKRANLVNILSDLEAGPFTVLAPNNQAFERLSNREVDDMLRNPEELSNLLKNHVLRDTLCCAGISRDSWHGGNHIRTMSGAVHRVSLNRHGEPVVAHARIVKCDRTASNGNILELDQILTRERPRWRSHIRRHFDRSPWRRFHY